MAITTDSDNDLPARPYLLDTGSSLPMGYIDDICEIDPTGERPPQAIIAFDTTVRRISRFVYLVYMQVRDEHEKALTGWHLTPFAINETPYPKVLRLSGLFPFQHLYWAKDPSESPEFWSVSNVLAGVTRGLRKRLGDDLREVENGKEGVDEEGEGEREEEDDGAIEVVVKDWVTAEELVLRIIEDY
ncbi:hypothetical protein BDD12DRAFT_863334 [Trichophaea hybrida]|nr:hypothetical protein BDD12DRAFT_863334 [Trichophaea hybrida]